MLENLSNFAAIVLFLTLIIEGELVRKRLNKMDNILKDLKAKQDE